LSHYVVVDIETTGLDPQRDRITWIAAVVLADVEIKQRWSTHLADTSAGNNDRVPTFADAAPTLLELLAPSSSPACPQCFELSLVAPWRGPATYVPMRMLFG
jgi:DNA polymerase III epsilon subunit-like protein